MSEVPLQPCPLPKLVGAVLRMGVPAEESVPQLHVYLAYKKPPPRRTLQ